MHGHGSGIGMTEERHSIMLENLLYLLCGLDTAYIRIGIKDKRYALFTEPGYPPQLVLPFESLAVNVRILNKFIMKSQYCLDAVRRIVSDCFESRMGRYLKRIAGGRGRIKNIETLMISVREDAEEFAEMREIVDGMVGMEGVEIVNFLRDRKGRTVHFAQLYSEIMDVCERRVREDVRLWVTEGRMTGRGFMVVENEGAEGFDESAWTHRYAIAEQNVPYFLAQDKDSVYGCGRTINIGRRILGNNMLCELAREYDGPGLPALNSYLNTQLMELLRSDLEKELSMMYKYVLLDEVSFYLDMFEELGGEIFVPTERTVVKMNAIRGSRTTEGFSLRISPVSLNEYVLKILSVQTQTSYKKRLSVLESLTVDYRPPLLCNFVSSKTLSELEIIFRFLFTLAGLSYHMGRFREFRFARAAVAVVDRLRFAFHCRVRPIEVKHDMDHVISNLLSSTKRWLRDFLLTSERIYCVVASLFDLCFEFLNIEHKSMLKHEEIRMLEDTLVCTVGRLKTELACVECDHLLLGFLEAIEWSNVFG